MIGHQQLPAMRRLGEETTSKARSPSSPPMSQRIVGIHAQKHNTWTEGTDRSPALSTASFRAKNVSQVLVAVGYKDEAALGWAKSCKPPLQHLP